MCDAETVEAALLVVQKAELMAKMGALPDFCGCSLEYVTTILTMDDDRFRGRDPQAMRWDLFEAFATRPDIFRLSKDRRSRWGTRWSTMPREKFDETFQPKAWL